MKIHLIGVSEDEANASLDEFGEITECSFKGCSNPSAEMLIVQKPGSDWGENINSIGACSEHLPKLHALIAKATK